MDGLAARLFRELVDRAGSGFDQKELVGRAEGHASSSRATRRSAPLVDSWAVSFLRRPFWAS